MIRNLTCMRTLSALMAVALLVWSSQDAFGAAQPTNTNVTFNARVTIKFAKTGPKSVQPIAMYINGKRFPVAMKDGQWSVQTTYRKLMTVSPEFKREFDRQVGEALGERFKELATTGKKGLEGGKSPAENQQRVAAETNKLAAQFTTAYAKTLDTTANAFPRFDYRLVTESALAAGAKKAGESTGGDQAVGEEAGGGAGEGSESDPEGSFLLFLGMLVLAVTAFVVPLLAIAWLASGALTLATFAAAVTGTVLAASAGIVFNAAMKWAATGEPMWSSYYCEVGGPGELGGMPVQKAP